MLSSRVRTRTFLFIIMSLFSLRISDMHPQAPLLLYLVRLITVCFCLRINALALASPKCLAFLFGGGVIVVSFYQFFLLMIFSFCQLCLAGDINWKLLVTLQVRTDEKRGKSLDNEGPRVTEEVHFLNHNVDC